MRLRTLTSLNWLLGTLAIGVAALLPVAGRVLWEDAARAEAEAFVARLVDAEETAYRKFERYTYFTAQPQDAAQAAKALGISIPAGDFVFDAHADAGNALVVRAFTAPAALQRGALPPMLYRFQVPSAGARGTGEWVALSGRTAGLQGLPATLAAMFQ